MFLIFTTLRGSTITINKNHIVEVYTDINGGTRIALVNDRTPIIVNQTLDEVGRALGAETWSEAINRIETPVED
jgi:hypothetical protein